MTNLRGCIWWSSIISASMHMIFVCPYTCPANRILTTGNVCCPGSSRHDGYIPEQDLKPCDLFPKGYKTTFAYCKDRMKTMCCARWKDLFCPWTNDPASWTWYTVPCPDTTAADGVWCLWDGDNSRFVTDY